MPTLLGEVEGHTASRAMASGVPALRSRKTGCMRGCVLCGSREIKAVGKGGPPTTNGARHTAFGEAVWKSDEATVVRKWVNKIE